MTRGKTGEFFLSVYQSDGITPQSLSGSVLYFHAKRGTVVINKDSSVGGISIGSTAGGTDCATLVIDPSDTASLVFWGCLRLDCELVLVNGSNRFPLNKGTLVIEAEVGAP